MQEVVTVMSFLVGVVCLGGAYQERKDAMRCATMVVIAFFSLLVAAGLFFGG